ncbi:hypothetical protein CDD80_6484 [Ophiocordyceps camponoti-rufipedis]|uniref:LysM domain-containing protein n=1 Tax=Ophiocordyceps camponoti-rufipedis TaxID=2004952 RepID=A0A2C5ZG26_9HYPO|nr:hypothetical protein CDD80_6484 [Ophiocordyceps camponoti-rufipedis]
MASPLSRLLLLGGYSALAAAGVPQPLPSEKLCQHRVKSGEFCYLIAENYKTTVPDLRKWNPQLDDACSLNPKDILNVPCVEPEKPMPKMDGPCTKFYTAAEGDTCYSIATCQAVAPQNLIAWNQLDEACTLEAGRELCVSHYEEPAECNKYHRVKKGDTCFDIAQSIGKDLSYLVELNPALLQPVCSLDVGYKVCIEAASESVIDDATFTSLIDALTSAAEVSGSSTSTCTSAVLVDASSTAAVVSVASVDASTSSTSVSVVSSEVSSKASTPSTAVIFTAPASVSAVSSEASTASTDASAPSTAVSTTPALVTSVSQPLWPLNRTTTTIVTTFITKSLTRSPSLPSSLSLPSSSPRPPVTLNVNISQELKARLRLICGRYVGNYTKPEPIPDSVLLPPSSQIEEMVKEAAKVKSEGLQVPGGNAVEAVVPSSGPQTIVLNQLFRIIVSASVDIRSSGCDTGACSLQVSYSANAGIRAPAAVGSELELPQSDAPAAASDETEEVGEDETEEDDEEGSCGAI